MSTINNVNNTGLPTFVAPTIQPLTPDAPAPVAPVNAPGTTGDLNKVQAGQLVAPPEAALKINAPLTAAPNVTYPASPPTGHENFVEGIKAEADILQQLTGMYSPLAQLDPNLQPLYLKMSGLLNTLNTLSYDPNNKTVLDQDSLRTALQRFASVSKQLNDMKTKPDPTTGDGLTKIQDLFNSTNLIDLGGPVPPAPVPTPRQNFELAGAAVSDGLNKLMGTFTALAQTDPALQSTFLEIQGMMDSVNGHLYGLSDTTGISPDTARMALQASKQINAVFNATPLPDPTTPAGKAKIDELFTAAKTLGTPYDPAPVPTPRENFETGGAAISDVLSKLGGLFSATQQLDPSMQPLYLQIRGLGDALNGKLYSLNDTTGLDQNTLRTVLKAAENISKALNKTPPPNPDKDLSQIQSLFDSAKAIGIPFSPAPPPTGHENFVEGIKAEADILQQLTGMYSPLAQLDPNLQPFYLKMSGLLHMLNILSYDPNNKTVLDQDSLRTALVKLQAVSKQLDAMKTKPDPTTGDGLAKIQDLFNSTNLIDMGAPVPPDPIPTPRENFQVAGAAISDGLSKLTGAFSAIAQTDPNLQSTYLEIVGMMDSVNSHLYGLSDTTGISPDTARMALQASKQINAVFNATPLPDPTTPAGKAKIDELFTAAKTLGTAFDPAPVPTLQENFHTGGAAAADVLTTITALFNAPQRLDPGMQPVYLKARGLLDNINSRIYALQITNGLTQGDLATLLNTVKTISGVLNDDKKKPYPGDSGGLSTINGWVTTLASQLRLPFVA